MRYPITLSHVARANACTLVALSRRGVPASYTARPDGRVTWVSGDAGDAAVLESIHAEHGPFDACLHCIGLLFDSQSGLSSLNKVRPSVLHCFAAYAPG